MTDPKFSPVSPARYGRADPAAGYFLVPRRRVSTQIPPYRPLPKEPYTSALADKLMWAVIIFAPLYWLGQLFRAVVSL